MIRKVLQPNAIVLTALLAGLTLILTAQQQTLLTEEDPSTSASLLAANQVYPDFFPLMAWDDVENEATIAKMAGAGINSIAFVPPELLDACQTHNIKAIVYDARVTPDWDVTFDPKVANAVLPELIEKHNDHPAVYGYHLKDEPDGNQLPLLGESAKLVRQLAPGKWPYINLPPGMGDWYESEYLQLFVDSCKPPFLSYDNYPIGETGTFSYGYWANMHDVRSAALRNDLPFHTIVLTAAHWNYRTPSDADLGLMVNGALAYGAKGIAYYKFRSRPLAVLGAPDLGNFRQAPLDEYDNKAELYDHVKRLNRKIAAMAPVLLKLHSERVYHIGEVPERNSPMPDDSLLESLQIGQQYIVGEFTHKKTGEPWIMVVNKDLANSWMCIPKFRRPVEKIEMLSPLTGTLMDYPTPYYALAPGQAVLLKPTFATPTE